MTLDDLLFLRQQMQMQQQNQLPQFADPRMQAMLPQMPVAARPPAAAPVPAPSPVQGPLTPLPPRRPEYDVKGYSKGLANAGPGAQQYADQFAGGDLSKVKSRLINIDGEMKNDYYVKGLLDAPQPQAPVMPDASSGGYGPPQPNFLQQLFSGFGGFFGG